MVCMGASMWGGSGVAGQYLLQDCGFSTEWLVVSRMLLAALPELSAGYEVIIRKASLAGLTWQGTLSYDENKRTKIYQWG